ncbi:hypothetical protein Q9966_015441 [Columba livia]|nr:hypothetical protein Q9966_015441 [Columba livia]
MLLCHALSPYEEELCSFWERLISSQKTNITSYITNLGEDGVERCSLMVEHGSRVMSNGNQRWFNMCCTSQAYNRQSLSDAQPITCINHADEQQLPFVSVERGLFAEKGQGILGVNWRHGQQVWISPKNYQMGTNVPLKDLCLWVLPLVYISVTYNWQVHNLVSTLQVILTPDRLGGLDEFPSGFDPRDLAHSRILKLDGFRKKGEISRDDRANVNSPSYLPIYLSVHFENPCNSNQTIVSSHIDTHISEENFLDSKFFPGQTRTYSKLARTRINQRDPNAIGAGIEIPIPSKGTGVKVACPFLADPCWPLVLAPSPPQDICPRLGSTALEEGKGSVGKRKKDHSVEKEDGVKRTGERGGRRYHRVNHSYQSRCSSRRQVSVSLLCGGSTKMGNNSPIVCETRNTETGDENTAFECEFQGLMGERFFLCYKQRIDEEKRGIPCSCYQTMKYSGRGTKDQAEWIQ